jgi:ATP phosphoribosyltransferase regulatory subunit HisZ
MMEVKFKFAGQGTINNTAGAVTLVNEQLTVPLPSLGLVLNYNITPKLQFQSRYDFFYLTMANYSGAMFELYGGLEYRIVKHFAMGAAYDRLSANLRGDQPQAGFQANFSYNLAYVYATLYLF